jgi:hypothetical protein
MALLGVLMIVGSAIRPVARRKHKKEAALQEPGTVELITFKAAYDVQLNQRRIWDLTSKMQIRLDSGGTFRGSYRTDVGLWTLQRWWRRAFPPQPGRLSRPFPNTQREAIDAIFHVGASWPCLYNPKNPDVVVVFPFPPLDDELNEQLEGTDHIEFWSAT